MVRTVVILAAGFGSRLAECHNGIPKSLVRVQDRVYLDLQLQAFLKYDYKIIVVGGFAFDVLEKHIHSLPHSQRITLVHNKEYQKGNLYTLLTAKNLIEGDFFLFNADHFYSDTTYEKILVTLPQVNDAHLPTVCVDYDRSLTDDDMKVTLQEGKVCEMSKQMQNFEAGYVGVTYIPVAKQEEYWHMCDVTADKLGDKANVEHVINELARQNNTVACFDISGSWWTEIDTPEDLAKAQSTIAKHIF